MVLHRTNSTDRLAAHRDVRALVLDRLIDRGGVETLRDLTAYVDRAIRLHPAAASPSATARRTRAEWFAETYLVGLVEEGLIELTDGPVPAVVLRPVDERPADPQT